MLRIVVLAALTLPWGPSVSTQETPLQEVTPDQIRSTDHGMRWLVANQNRDGLWGCEKSGAPSTAITGLAILALLASGSTPTAGPHAESIRRAIDRLVAIQVKSGAITRFDSTGMGIFYDHSCATLALAEAYGMRRTSEGFSAIRESLERALEYLYGVQNSDGGWGPQGRGSRSDIAITCSVWMALRSARNAGMTVRSASIEKLEEFVRTCALPRGGFAEHPQVRGGGGLMFYPTSAGLRILWGMGRGNLAETEKGMAALLKMRLGQEHGGRISEWDYCGAFYAVQAMMHEGATYWKTWWPPFRDRLVQIQNADGSWTIEYCLCCRAYATALALLVLQAPKRLLPLYQL